VLVRANARMRTAIAPPVWRGGSIPVRNTRSSRTHAHTTQQLLDAVAIGQVIPGPVFTTATFIGFLLGGVSGALRATLGIFLPGFIFVALSYPLIPRIRHSPWTSGLLDGVNITALGLMAAVTWQLSRASLIDPLTGVLALLSLGLLLKYQLNATWLVLGGAGVGLLRTALS
jgi:chromate transporter